MRMPQIALLTLISRKTLAEMGESRPPQINRDVNKTGPSNKSKEESIGTQEIETIKAVIKEEEVAEEEGGVNITAEVAEAETVGTATIVSNLRTGTDANQS